MIYLCGIIKNIRVHALYLKKQFLIDIFFTQAWKRGKFLNEQFELKKACKNKLEKIKLCSLKLNYLTIKKNSFLNLTAP